MITVSCVTQLTTSQYRVIVEVSILLNLQINTLSLLNPTVLSPYAQHPTMLPSLEVRDPTVTLPWGTWTNYATLPCVTWIHCYPPLRYLNPLLPSLEVPEQTMLPSLAVPESTVTLPRGTWTHYVALPWGTWTQLANSQCVFHLRHKL
jgi:hypothetical protein